METDTTQSPWQRFFDARAELSPRDAEEAYRKAQMATAYVWGFQDSQGREHADSQAATNFGLAYGLACCAYLSGESYFLRSIPDSFAQTLKEG